MSEHIAHIIVDVDGTLLDSKRDIAGAQKWVLEQLGVSGYQLEDLYRTIGRKLEDTFRELTLSETGKSED